MATFSLLDLGEGLQEAEIVAWHVHSKGQLGCRARYDHASTAA